MPRYPQPGDRVINTIPGGPAGMGRVIEPSPEDGPLGDPGDVLVAWPTGDGTRRVWTAAAELQIIGGG